jgi:hypothetical protein
MPYWAAYSATKAALAGIPVSVLTLGAFATDIRREALAAWPSSAAYESARRVRRCDEMSRSSKVA